MKKRDKISDKILKAKPLDTIIQIMQSTDDDDLRFRAAKALLDCLEKETLKNNVIADGITVVFTPAIPLADITAAAAPVNHPSAVHDDKKSKQNNTLVDIDDAIKRYVRS